jgi:DNA excision repair protein ERCC-4
VLFLTTPSYCCRSAAATVEIFKSIVASHEAVDVLKAVSVGANSTDATGAAAGEDNSAELAAQEILLSLPGINVQNFRKVMNNVESLAELSKMSQAQLTPLIGPVNAKKLYVFFRQRRLA